MTTCPKCGRLNDDDWPITVGRKVLDGGCQMCWEEEADLKWWKTVVALDENINFERIGE